MGHRPLLQQSYLNGNLRTAPLAGPSAPLSRNLMCAKLDLIWRLFEGDFETKNDVINFLNSKGL